MRRLPPHHLPRPRLVERCADFHVIVVEAAGGYGKSTLAIELVDGWRVVGIDLQLEHGGVPATLLAARLRAGVLRAGFTEAAGAAAEAGEDPVGAVDAVVAALAGENVAFVIDDAHEARPDAAALIDRIAGRLEGEQRLLVLARRLPEGASRLRRAEYLRLTSTDLALSDEETFDLCRSGFGLDIEPEGAHALGLATGGWTAATVLAAARAARTGEALGAVASAVAVPGPAGAVGEILEEALVALKPDSFPLLAQIARLPLLDASIVDLATGLEGFFDRALAAGLPLTPGRGLWWDLPGPVRDHLVTLAPSNADTMRRVAAAYDERGELGEALQLLLAAGEPDAAARLLARTPPEAVESVDGLELEAVFDQLPDDVVERNPSVLVVVARGSFLAGPLDRAVSLFERALAIALRTGDAALERAARVELANNLARRLDKEAAAAEARRILTDADPSEKLTRARAYEVLAESLCWQLDESGRRDEHALTEAEDCFRQACNLYRGLNMRSAISSVAPYWAISIDFAKGHAEKALRRLDEALETVTDRPRRRGFLMAFRAWVAADLGLDDLCRSSVEELFDIAELLTSEVFFGHGHWKLAILLSYRGDAEGTVDHLRKVETHIAAWWGHASGDFLAEAADLADRVGQTALAFEYLERVKAEPKDAGHLIALSEAIIEARHGDPARAAPLLEAAERRRIDPREYWRVTLLKAYAAYRRGDSAGAGAGAARAFEEAAQLGQPGLPLIRERAVTEQLLGLAAETGQPAAVALQATSLPLRLALLGRFELTAAGRPVPLPSGQVAQLLKLVAASGGRLHSEAAVESLWPEADRDTGRNRLRTVLNRLRSDAGDVLKREGEILVLDPALRVDVDDFLAEAGRAMALAAADPGFAAAVARGAIARYRGDLLPDDCYETWAEKPRDRAREAMLDLLDLVADDAALRGDLDALRRIVAQIIEFAPYDDVRYLRAASTFLREGRRGEALSIVRRARSALAEIGVQPPRQLIELEESIVT